MILRDTYKNEHQVLFTINKLRVLVKEKYFLILDFLGGGFVVGLLKTGEHGFEVRQRRMPQGCQVGMHKDKGGEEEKQ